MCVCVCVCVCWGGRIRENAGRDVRKEKLKECERRYQCCNEQPLVICAWVGVTTVLAYARVTHHGIYLHSLYGI